MDQGTILMIVVVVAFGGMMWWQSRNAKKRQAQVRDFRESLEPGSLVVSIGGVIGKVVSVDTKYEEIVIDSDGSLLRFTFNAISKRYERPAFVDDDEAPEAQATGGAQETAGQIDDSAPTAEPVTADESTTQAPTSSTTPQSDDDTSLTSSAPVNTSLPVVAPEHTTDATAAQIPFDSDPDGKDSATRQ